MQIINNSLLTITLNRPEVYNALNLELTRSITDALEQALKNPDIKTILIRSSMDKVFCAGGDVKAAYYAKTEGNKSYAEEFFRAEYQLNYLISTYPKPIIALINGLTLGGGMGLAMHAKYRVVNEFAQLGMPETTIGFFTDVGAGHFYKKLPLSLNLYFSLTGETLDYHQALSYGLATHFVPKDEEADFVLSSSDFTLSSSHLLRGSLDPRNKSEDDNIDIINTCFKDDSIEAIFERLQEHPSTFAKECLNLLFKKSPTSLKVVFELIKRSKKLSLKEILEQDFILSQNFMNHPDCMEGVRAQVIDKDKNPKWNPDDLKSVTDEMVAQFFIEKPGLKGLFDD